MISMNISILKTKELNNESVLIKSVVSNNNKSTVWVNIHKIDFLSCNKQSKYPVGLACTTVLEYYFQFHDDILIIYH